MTENAPEALAPDQTEVWHVDFHLSWEPECLTPRYLRAEVSHRPAGPKPQEWAIEGIASFEAPTLVVPRVGAEVLPYLIYHLDEIKGWLIEEHVRRVFNGQEETISNKVGVMNPPPGYQEVTIP